MLEQNIAGAWLGILFGLLSGVPVGLKFHDSNWMGGYDSWERRLFRLGHISCFGVAFLNLAFVVTASFMRLDALVWVSRLFLAGQVTMPAVCFLSAHSRVFRHLFFLPAGAVICATGMLLCELVGQAGR